MTKYTYLLIDFFSISVPFLVSFHPKSGLYKHWYALLPAIIVTSLFYLVWDSWFTSMGVWGFNSTYITGIHVGNMPLEEILFFVCIPYACVFTFDCLIRVIPENVLSKSSPFISYTLIGLCIIIAAIYRNNYYTASAFGLLALLIFAAYYKKVRWLGRFYIIYIILLIPFTIVNGLLTGTCLDAPVVWYNPDHIIGARILTIPIEDVFYGMGLLLINTWIYQRLRYGKNHSASAIAG
ncbi:lycopene cyclase domain-containing protein [Mucilaginibacter auburnensis]|uniref:Lycopene cyclase domain-containing protein n=1 Tax=Mucilaginibacter auburnensis TaxID=1457233 RepID=A0A2H9VLV0_9SPHI|nr:lycopene cyclase domain-containing protein [Mucilaginibacter auburnensis]PJJ79301.1 lycopene cyclase domain-containing protein [Mucilaginibacter auburnensis]